MFITTNTKLKKSNAFGYSSYGIHLAPGKLSGLNVCTSASKGCLDSCLFSSGFGAYDKVQQARIKKTKVFLNDIPTEVRNIAKEIQSKVNGSKRNNAIPTFRLNLTSDLAWESIKIDGKNLMEMFPTVQFMDYTKSLPRMIRYLTGKMPKNYHLTFSRSENNDNDCNIVLGCGGRVAVVFLNEIPKTWNKRKVINGDENDLRFLDKGGSIVGLVAKGKKAKRDESGFVIKSHLKNTKRK